MEENHPYKRRWKVQECGTVPPLRQGTAGSGGARLSRARLRGLANSAVAWFRAKALLGLTVQP